MTEEHYREYGVRWLSLYDTQEEREHGPVIELVRSLPGVDQAHFRDAYNFRVKRLACAVWEDIEPQVQNLLAGARTCSDAATLQGEVYVSDLPIEQRELVAALIMKASVQARREREE